MARVPLRSAAPKPLRRLNASLVANSNEIARKIAGAHKRRSPIVIEDIFNLPKELSALPAVAMAKINRANQRERLPPNSLMHVSASRAVRLAVIYNEISVSLTLSFAFDFR